mmetsp:Transcript_15118/g.25734  ORF Transcript_15118/g.25734 Transcript_15118/m.25734 type:complete len:228 (+) Transcript_15118:854-1537(+)
MLLIEIFHGIQHTKSGLPGGVAIAKAELIVESTGQGNRLQLMDLGPELVQFLRVRSDSCRWIFLAEVRDGTGRFLPGARRDTGDALLHRSCLLPLRFGFISALVLKPHSRRHAGFEITRHFGDVLGCCIDDVPKAQGHVVEGAAHGRAGPHVRQRSHGPPEGGRFLRDLRGRAAILAEVVVALSAIHHRFARFDLRATAVAPAGLGRPGLELMTLGTPLDVDLRRRS